MQVISDIEDCRQAVLKQRQAGLSVGIVPTLGALHRAHRSLVAAAKERCAVVVVTIFVFKLRDLLKPVLVAVLRLARIFCLA